MKKHLLFLLLMMLSLAVNASEMIDGIYYNLDSNTKTATVVYHFRYYYSGDIVIPSSVTHDGMDYSVTRIESSAFRGSSDLTSLRIPHSITSIGVGIFENCTSLASINIEEGNSVFDSRDNCNAIIETASNTLIVGCKGSTIPNGVTSIGKNAFYGCTALTSFNIPNHVVTIGESAFERCSGLTSVAIGNGVTTIGRDAFKDCANLTKVELNNNTLVSKDNSSVSPTPITSIFGSQVEEYVIGEDVLSIGNNAFWGNTNLTSVKMSNSVTSIGENAFEGCSSLASVDISDNVTRIGNLAFHDCYNLTSITIPSGVTDIELWTFDGCSLAKVIINSNAIVAKDYNSGSSLTRLFGLHVKEFVLGEEITSIGNNAFNGNSAISINIPYNVTSIGESAFAGSAITSINIPGKVTSIGDNAFYNCTGLTSVQVESGNTVYDSRENCNALIRTEDNTLMVGCQNTKIPNSVTAIDDYAFYFCTGLTSITIPNGVKTIGDFAFTACENLASVILPINMSSIGIRAFAFCEKMTDIYCYAEELPELGDLVFYNSQANATLHVPAASLETYKAADQWKDFKSFVALTDEDPKPTAISSKEYVPLTATKAIFDLQGHQLTQPKKGINIFKMSDGTTKKVMIK